ncbi:putative transmembrane protein [Toxoplasma gondii RUB]|uniref:Putative transmembrane protein n=2 Tax=Toxoplasma gondii TaxID=5811 RepID=V4ZFX8_TOXGV|nr:putative transmembrane protein [Toxoplasma gondii VEG]KFG61023.1 putative transmembrane protein [Toxoplasma gondii RUB]CEL76410.1 TPA: hypothetical protein BN1205_068295 [Toxoplasma gondii VEG]
MHAKSANASPLFLRLLLFFPAVEGSLRFFTRRLALWFSLAVLVFWTLLGRAGTLASSSSASLPPSISSLSSSFSSLSSSFSSLASSFPSLPPSFSSLFAGVHMRSGLSKKAANLSPVSSPHKSESVSRSISSSVSWGPLSPNSAFSTFPPLSSSLSRSSAASLSSSSSVFFTSLSLSTSVSVSSPTSPSSRLLPDRGDVYMGEMFSAVRRLAASEDVPSTQKETSDNGADESSRSPATPSLDTSAISHGNRGAHESHQKTNSPLSSASSSSPSSASSSSPSSASPSSAFAASSASSAFSAPLPSSSAPSSAFGRVEAREKLPGGASGSLSASSETPASPSGLRDRQCDDGGSERCRTRLTETTEDRAEQRRAATLEEAREREETAREGGNPGDTEDTQTEVSARKATEIQVVESDEEQHPAEAKEETGEKKETKGTVAPESQSEKGEVGEETRNASGVEEPPNRDADARRDSDDRRGREERREESRSKDAEAPLLREDADAEREAKRGFHARTAKDTESDTDSEAERADDREGERGREAQRGVESENKSEGGNDRELQKVTTRRSEVKSPDDPLETDSEREASAALPAREATPRAVTAAAAAERIGSAVSPDKAVEAPDVSEAVPQSPERLQKEAVHRSKVRGRQATSEETVSSSGQREENAQRFEELQPRPEFNLVPSALFSSFVTFFSSLSVSSVVSSFFSPVFPARTPPSHFLASLLYVLPDSMHHAAGPTENAEVLLEEEEVVLSGDPGEADQALFAQKQRGDENAHAGSLREAKANGGQAFRDGDALKSSSAGGRGEAAGTQARGTPPWGLHFAETFEGEMICFQWNVFNGAFSLALAYLCSPLYRHGGFGLASSAAHAGVSTLGRMGPLTPGPEGSVHSSAAGPFPQVAHAVSGAVSWLCSRLCCGGAASLFQSLKRLFAGSGASALPESPLPLPSFASSPSRSPSVSSSAPIDFAQAQAFPVSAFSPFEAVTPALGSELPGGSGGAGRRPSGVAFDDCSLFARRASCGEAGGDSERANARGFTFGARPGLEGVGNLPLRSTWRLACLSAQALQSSSAVLQSFGCTYTSPASTFVGWILATLSVTTSFLHPMLSLFSNCVSAAYDVYALMW